MRFILKQNSIELSSEVSSFRYLPNAVYIKIGLDNRYSQYWSQTMNTPSQVSGGTSNWGLFVTVPICLILIVYFLASESAIR